MVINELKMVLAQCLGMDPTHTEISVSSRSQRVDMNSGMFYMDHHPSLKSITIKGPAEVSASQAPLPYGLIGCLISCKTTTLADRSLWQEFTFAHDGTEVEFLEHINGMWREIYDKMFDKQLDEIINA